MADIKTCDFGGCKAMGLAGKGHVLERVRKTIFLANPTEKLPFRSMTVLWHLCPEHVGAAEAWARRVSGQADFSDLDASTVGSNPVAPEEPS